MKPMILITAGLLALMSLGACRHRYGRDHSDRILKHIDRRIGSLDLSPEQNRKYQAIRARLKADLKSQFQVKKAMLQEVKAEFNKENPDIKAAMEKMKAHLESRGKRMAVMPDYFGEFYEILTEAQKKKVIEKIRSKVNRHI